MGGLLSQFGMNRLARVPLAGHIRSGSRACRGRRRHTTRARDDRSDGRRRRSHSAARRARCRGLRPPIPLYQSALHVHRRRSLRQRGGRRIQPGRPVDVLLAKLEAADPFGKPIARSHVRHRYWAGLGWGRMSRPQGTARQQPHSYPPLKALALSGWHATPRRIADRGRRSATSSIRSVAARRAVRAYAEAMTASRALIRRL